MIRVLICCTAHTENQVELQQTFEDLIAKIEQEESCIGCELYKKVKDPKEFLLVEEWVNLVHIRNHVISQNLAVLAGAGKILCQKIHVSLERDELIEELNTALENRLIQR